MKITILLVNPKDILHMPGAWFIRLIDKTKFSHVALQLSYKNESKIYHSVFPKTKIESVEEFRKKYSIYKKYDFEMKDEKAENLSQHFVTKYMNALSSQPYSIAQLLLIAIGKISRGISLVTNRWILNHERYLICTELVGIFMTVFLLVDFEKSTDNIDLTDIENACEKLKGV